MDTVCVLGGGEQPHRAGRVQVRSSSEGMKKGVKPTAFCQEAA